MYLNVPSGELSSTIKISIGLFFSVIIYYLNNISEVLFESPNYAKELSLVLTK